MCVNSPDSAYPRVQVPATTVVRDSAGVRDSVGDRDSTVVRDSAVVRDSSS